MKKIGLIGGMSWESTQIYYKVLNQKVKELLGKFHSAKIVIDSVDFSVIHKLQGENDWDALDKEMIEAATNLKNAKAEMVLICANTMHLCSDAVKQNVDLPLIHIAEATGEKIKEAGLKKVLLLGTKFTMERDFYKNILTNDFGIEVLVPNEDDREIVHNIIYEELVQGEINAGSRGQYIRIIYEAIKNGAEGVILGCTEIPLLIQPSDVSIPTFNTTQIHAEKAVEFALSTSLVN
jgi:aspartate racemase